MNASRLASGEIPRLTFRWEITRGMNFGSSWQTRLQQHLPLPILNAVKLHSSRHCRSPPFLSSMTASPICNSCRARLKIRLRNHILLLQSQRRSYYASRILAAGVITPVDSRSWYWETVPPTSKDLASATNFFQTYLPRKLWTATEWRKQNEPVGGTLVPEVAFLGRSNVGKSSLLNALLLSPQLNHVGPRPGKTSTMHAWGLAASDPVTGGARRGHSGDMSIKIAVLDMPGYGHASHGDWGQEIITYLTRRKQLKRVFVLLDALHGIKVSDLRMLDLLREKSISHQVIASKCDRLGKGDQAQTALTEVLWKMKKAVQPESRTTGFVGLGEILSVGALGDGKSNSNIRQKNMIGIEEVRYAVLKAAGLESTNSPHLNIPAVVAKKSPLFPESKPSTDIADDKVVALKQISSSAYMTADGIISEDYEALTPPRIALRTGDAEDATLATGEAQAAAFQPFLSGHRPSHTVGALDAPPKSLRNRAKLLNDKKKGARVLPVSQTNMTVVSEKLDNAGPEISSPLVQKQRYAGSIGYGLRDLFEMTATKLNRDHMVNPRSYKRGQQDAPRRMGSKNRYTS